MFARVSAIQFGPSQVDNAIKAYQDSASDIRDQQGFHEGMLLIDRGSDQGMSISIWENEDALNQSMGVFQQVVQRASEALQGEPKRTHYEVLEHRPGQNRKFARVSTGTVKPEWFDDQETQHDTSIIDAASRQPGYAGFLVLADRSNNQVKGMSFWDSKEHLEASEGGSGYYQQEMEKSRDQWEGGWKREAYEIAVDL